jgi:hypothetical protein
MRSFQPKPDTADTAAAAAEAVEGAALLIPAFLLLCVCCPCECKLRWSSGTYGTGTSSALYAYEYCACCTAASDGLVWTNHVFLFVVCLGQRPRPRPPPHKTLSQQALWSPEMRRLCNCTNQPTNTNDFMRLSLSDADSWQSLESSELPNASCSLVPTRVATWLFSRQVLCCAAVGCLAIIVPAGRMWLMRAWELATLPATRGACSLLLLLLLRLCCCDCCCSTCQAEASSSSTRPSKLGKTCSIGSC